MDRYVLQLFFIFTLSYSFYCDAIGENNKQLVSSLLDYHAPIPTWNENSNYLNMRGNKNPQQGDSTDSLCDISSDIDDFMGCWSSNSFSFMKRSPLNKGIQSRILNNIQDYKEYIPYYLRKNILPNNHSSVNKIKNIYDDCKNDTRCVSDSEKNDWLKSVKYWLTVNSDYFIDDLISLIKYPTNIDYEEHYFLLNALFKQSPTLAKKISDDWIKGTNLYFNALIKLNYYERQVTDELRSELVNITMTDTNDHLTNSFKQQYPKIMGYKFLIIEKLLSSTWQNKSDYFRTIIEKVDADKLYKITKTNPDYFIPILIGFVNSSSRELHNKTVEVLSSFNLKNTRKDALRPLLPWLSSPTWTNISSMKRLRLIQSLDRVNLLESINGLIWVLENDLDDAYIQYAAETLSFYKPNNISPVFRRAIRRMKDTHYREKTIMLALNLGVYTVAECTEGILAFADFIKNKENRESWDNRGYGQPLFDEKLVIGSLVSRIRSKELQDNIVHNLLENRQLTNAQLLTISDWGHQNIDKEIIKRLSKEVADPKLIFSLLNRRQNLKQREKELLLKILNIGSYGSGIASILINDNNVIEKTLYQGNELEVSGLLASARLLRIELDVKKVASFQNSINNLLSKSAKLYLEMNDSPEARKFRQSSKTDDILILGARTSFDPGHFSYSSFNKLEKKLLDIYDLTASDEIFALISAGYWGNRGQQIITIKDGKGKLTLFQENGRFKYVDLSKDELNDFITFIRLNEVDDLAPYTPNIHDGIQYEYIHIKPEFGRRVFMNNPGRKSDIYRKIVAKFQNLLKEKTYKIDYLVREKEKNIELLALSEKPKAWLKYNQKYARVKSQCGDEISTWQARSLKQAIYGTAWELYQCIEGSKKVMTDNGSYGREPVITPDGKWLLSAKLKEGDWSNPNHIALINLTSQHEKILPIEPAQNLDPVVWLENHRKFLIFRTNNDIYIGMADNETANHENYLYDPYTKTLEKTQGDFLWIEDHYKLPLKPTNEKNIVWMARPNYEEKHTVFGKYNLEDFSFRTIKIIEELIFTSQDIWISENESKLYIDTGNDLLMLPL